MRRVLVLSACAALLPTCTCGVPGVGDDEYACKTDADCVSSNACISGRCRPKGTTACATVDCADPACDGRPCGPSGKTCAGKACSCSGNGGTAQATETACGDGYDNDCNGLTDCADTSCAGLACGMGGTCQGTLCVCPAAGNMPQSVETKCGDGLDNDCDGKTDCADPSCANIGCGQSGLVCVADAGACQCGGNGGVREGSETACADLADNDCDGLTDCADDTCNGQACKPNGWLCMGMVCTCLGNGGASEPARELSCNDGHDNDCDGLVDCLDPSCANQSCGAGCTCVNGAKRETACTDTLDNDGDQATDCADSDCGGVACGANGLACAMGTCRCVVDGGVAEAVETHCADGKDNDCNGLVDCDEGACLGLSCGTNGRVCVGTTCTCFIDGGVTEPTEVSCTDGRDNDCDGLSDCADPDCNAASCGVGCVCQGGAKTETNCNDGMDNDGDGMADCLDSQCSHKQCGATAGFVCCGTSCKNLTNDAQNCGGCGRTCSQGCIATTSGGVPSGRCGCNGNGQCSMGQNCSGGSCACSSAAECVSGETCATSACHY